MKFNSLVFCDSVSFLPSTMLMLLLFLLTFVSLAFCNIGELCTNSTQCSSQHCVPIVNNSSSICCATKCDVEACSTILAGWRRQKCGHFSTNSTGKCEADGSCLDCDHVVSQTTVDLFSCGSAGCVRRNACIAGDPIPPLNQRSVEQVCFTDEKQHACDADDEVCDKNGTCLKVAGSMCSFNADCLSNVCWKPPAGMPGVCCDRACAGECNGCESGQCEGFRGVPCQMPVNTNATAVCKVCTPNDKLSECRTAATKCSAVGGLSGDQFGCRSEESCFDGQCIACAGADGLELPVMCGANNDTFTANMLLINPTLGRLEFCRRWSIEFYTIGSTCAVQWRPQRGAGVDCGNKTNEIDGMITAGTTEDEFLKMFVELPENSTVRLSFGNFEVGDTGRVTAESMVVGRVREDTTSKEISFNESQVLIDLWVARIYISATKGSFVLQRVEVLQSQSPTTTTTTNLSLSTMMTTTDLSVSSTTAVNSSASTNSTQSESTTTIVGEKGFAERLNDGFAGKDDAYLGGFVAILIVVILAVVACIVVAIAVKKRRSASATGGTGASMESIVPQSQYAVLPTVALPPPLAYDSVPTPSYDVVPSKSNYDVGDIKFK